MHKQEYEFMNGWLALFKALIHFLEKPNGLGVLVLLSGMLLALFLAPIAVLTYINIDDTNRIVNAIHEINEHCQDFRLARTR